MAATTWDARLETGNAKIDQQHRTLFDALFRLRCALEAHRGGEELRSTFDFLKVYAAVHFQTEESLMTRHDYSGIAAHQAWHRRFSAQVKALAEDPEGDSEMKAEELVRFLEKWLAEHILDEDRRMVEEVREKSVAL